MNNFYTVYELLREVDSNLHGGAVNQLIDRFVTIDKGRRSLLTTTYPEELVRKTYIENAIYGNVNRYAAPADLRHIGVRSLKLLPAYRNVDTMDHDFEIVYQRRFGEKRGNSANVMSINYENGIKYIELFRPNTNQCNRSRNQLIHDCDSLDSNGTWNVGGNVENFRLDQLNHVSGRASYKFDINNSSNSGFIENFTMMPVDISTFLNKGAIFSWLNLTIPREIISVELTLGSNTGDLTTDLYQSTVNSPHDSNIFTLDWNLLKFMCNTLRSVGTPNPRAISYVRLTFKTTGNPIPNCGVDNIIVRDGAVYEITYDSPYMFLDATTHAWKKIPDSDDDIVVAEEDTFNILTLEVSKAAQREIYLQGGRSQKEMSTIENDLALAYEEYNMNHKTDMVLESDSSHVFGNMYDGYSDDLQPGFGNQYGQYDNGQANFNQ